MLSGLDRRWRVRIRSVDRPAGSRRGCESDAQQASRAGGGRQRPSVAADVWRGAAPPRLEYVEPVSQRVIYDGCWIDHLAIYLEPVSQRVIYDGCWIDALHRTARTRCCFRLQDEGRVFSSGSIMCSWTKTTSKEKMVYYYRRLDRPRDRIEQSICLGVAFV